ncbi:hypothetical protein KSS87_000024, partial [Heliosperma pusillum]
LTYPNSLPFLFKTYFPKPLTSLTPLFTTTTCLYRRPPIPPPPYLCHCFAFINCNSTVVRPACRNVTSIKLKFGQNWIYLAQNLTKMSFVC